MSIPPVELGLDWMLDVNVRQRGLKKLLVSMKLERMGKLSLRIGRGCALVSFDGFTAVLTVDAQSAHGFVVVYRCRSLALYRQLLDD